MKVTRIQLRSQLERQLIEHISIKQINEVAIELYPYFKKAILEERSDLRAYMLLEGHYDLYESMVKEDKLLNEGILDTVADVGITVGQMVGGGVGQAAGVAGLIKYTPEFQNNIGKSFLEWFGPFISLFFSVQALFFPMPAVGSLKTILKGFVSGVKNMLSGAGGLAASGVRLVFQKGSGFITKMIDLFKTAAGGIGKAIARGGDDVAKIETKLGGSGKLSSMFKSLSGAIEEFIKRLGVIKEGIKHYGGKLSPANIKDVLTRAFQSSKDKLDDGVAYYKGAKTAAATEGKSLASFMTKKGVTAAKTKFTSIVGSSFKKINSWLVSFMTKNPELLSKFVGKEMVSKTGLTYVFKGMDDAGNFILKTNKQGVAAAKGIVKQNKVALSAEKQIYKGYGKAVAKTADENLAVVMKSQTAAKKALEKKIQKQVYDKQRTKAFKAASATGKQKMIQNIRGAGRKKLAALNKQNKEAIKQIKALNKADAARQQSMISQQTVSAAKGTAAKNAAAMAKGTKEFADVPVSAAQFFSCYGHMWFGVAKTGVKKATGVAMPEFDQFLIYLTHLYPPKQAAADIARIVAASQGGGFDDFDAEAYKSPIRSNRRKRPGEEGYKSVSDKLGSVMSAAGLDESLYLDEIIWESNLRRKMLKEQKLISFIH